MHAIRLGSLPMSNARGLMTIRAASTTQFITRFIGATIQSNTKSAGQRGLTMGSHDGTSALRRFGEARRGDSRTAHINGAAWGCPNTHATPWSGLRRSSEARDVEGIRGCCGGPAPLRRSGRRWLRTSAHELWRVAWRGRTVQLQQSTRRSSEQGAVIKARR
jgi:hypothetical protein